MRANKKIFITALMSLMLTLCVVFGVGQLDLQSASAAETTGTFAQTGFTVKNGSAVLSDVIADPVKFTDAADNGMLTNSSETLDQSVLTGNGAVVFTAEYPYTTTKRVGAYKEYTVEYVEKQYKVTKVNTSGDGTTYIPVGGYVLSLPENSTFTVAVGDVLTADGLVLVDKAVESDKGARIAIDALNGVRTGYMVVYYDYDFGAKTGTNVFGTELAAVFDEASSSFVIKSFRGFGWGDDSGIEIPDNGFVLSAHGEKFRGQLVENQRFSVGDKLSLVGFDYIRFGGDPVTFTYNYVYRDADSATDEFNQNDGRWETETSPYDAYRGENQTIIYKHGWSYKGSSGTGTNVYGFEAAVDADGNVVERGVNVSKIPENGYVISGHGTGRDFIRSSIPLGAKITLDEGKKEISITTSLNSFFVNTQTTVNGIVASAQKKVEQLYDVDGAKIGEKIAAINGVMSALEEVKVEIEEKIETGTWTKEEKTRALMRYNAQKLQAENLAYEILALSSESRPVTARAVWHRPVEKNLETLTATLDTYEELGINLVFVETFYNGYSLFKSNYVEYHKDFVSASYGEYTDYLSAFVALAKARGIEVHAWVEDFYVGLSDQVKLLQDHPDWIMYNNDGSYLQKNEGGAYIFIDPANPAVQNFLIAYYKELLDKNPDIAGLNLDYIRYPVSNRDEDTGYTVYAMKNFAKTLGLDGKLTATDTKKMITQFKQYILMASSLNYQKWCDYRMQAVTDFVERVYKEIKLEKKIILSTAVFSSITKNKEEKKQDWQTWFKKGWIDIATPMAYFDADTEVLSGVSQMIVAAGTKCYYYTGLASSYRGLPAYENCYQIEASYMGGASGYVIFCSTQIIGHDDVQGMLQAGVNAKDAVLPHAETSKVLNAYFSAVLDRASNIYLPAGGMTAEQVTALGARFEKIKAMPSETAAELTAIRAEIEKLTKTSGVSAFAKGYSSARIRETMGELSDLLKTKIQRLTPVVDDEPTTPNQPSNPPVNSGSEGNGSGREESGCKNTVGVGMAAIAALAMAGVAITAKCSKKENE